MRRVNLHHTSFHHMSSYGFIFKDLAAAVVSLIITLASSDYALHVLWGIKCFSYLPPPFLFLRSTCIAGETSKFILEHIFPDIHVTSILLNSPFQAEFLNKVALLRKRVSEVPVVKDY